MKAISMSKIYNNIVETVGRIPLVKLNPRESWRGPGHDYRVEV